MNELPDQSQPTDPTYSIRAVERVCDLLDLLQESSGTVSLPRAAEVTGLPKSSAFRYLATLEGRRYVERDPRTGEYRLGTAFLPLQSRQLDLVVQRARPYLLHLRDQYEETANLGLLDGNRIAYLDIVESMRGVRLAARAGDRDPVHSTALGKAVLAQLPEDRVLTILSGAGMPQQTEHTITDQRAYLGELAAVRERGFAVDDRENEPDGRCVAVPLRRSGLPAALSVSAPASRLPMAKIPEIAQALAEVASKLVGDLGGRF